MVATTIWRPVCCWNASSFCRSAASRSSGITFASSTTSPLNLGKVCAVAGAATHASNVNASAVHHRARAWDTGLLAKVDSGRLVRIGSGRLIWHQRLGAVHQFGADRFGEGADARVIIAHRLIIIADRD